MVDITSRIKDSVKNSGVKNGALIVYTPHTTAAITVNENADPDVASDMIRAFNEMIPAIRFDHREGNSPSHILSSLVGASEHFIIENGQIILGTWQGIYFCEFDGPRDRKVLVQMIGQ